MRAVASQITVVSIVYSNFYSHADQRKHQSPTSLAFVRGIHWWLVNSTQRTSNAENVPIWWHHHDSFFFFNFQKPDIDTTNQEQQDAALCIQTKYRQYHSKKVVQEKREEKAAVKIQAGYRGHLDRERVKSIKYVCKFLPSQLKFDENWISLSSRFLKNNHYKILHLPQQLCCCGMCKILLWYDHHEWSYSKVKFRRIWIVMKRSLVNCALGW